MIIAPPVEYLIHLRKLWQAALHFHFGTENGEDKPKNTLLKYDCEGGSGKISWRSRGRSGWLANFWLASSREASPPNSVRQKVAKHWTSKQPPKQSGLKEEKKASLIRSVLVSCPTRLSSSWRWRPLIWKKVPIEKRSDWEKIRLRKDPIEKRSDWEKIRLRIAPIEKRSDWDGMSFKLQYVEVF